MIRGDNGTNLTGGEREIHEALNSWNQQKTEGFLHQKNIKWKFNPPGASHMGGIWEQVIRSVRKILSPSQRAIGFWRGTANIDGGSRGNSEWMTFDC